MFLTVTEAAELLHCHPETVRKLAAGRKLPGAKVGKAWIFEREQLVGLQLPKRRTKAQIEEDMALKSILNEPTHEPGRRVLLEPGERDYRRRARKASYRRTNRGKFAAYAAARKAARMQATPAWSDLKAIESIYLDAAAITARTRVEHHVDHIVPLQARNASGLHVHWNLRIIPAAENLRRPRDYMGELCF